MRNQSASLREQKNLKAALKRVAAGVLAAAALQSSAYAQDPAAQYPSKPVRLVVPFPPGGATDIVARLVAQKLTDAMGQTFIVENQSGAGGTIGTEAVARATADGYTLGMATSSTHGAAPSLYPKLAYDPLKSFEPVSLVATTPFILAVHPALPVRSVNELIKLAKSQPGKLNYATPGNGSANHLTVEMFSMMANIKLTHVPYKGSGPALVDLVAGRVDLVINDMSSLFNYVKSGKVRPLAVASSKRNARLPDVPAIAESVPGYEAEAWYGVLAPAGTPTPIVAKLHDEIAKAARTGDLRERLAAQALDTVASTPAEFRAYMERDVARWAKVVKAANVRLE